MYKYSIYYEHGKTIVKNKNQIKQKQDIYIYNKENI